MPRVERYGPRRVGTAPLPGVRRERIDEPDFASEAQAQFGAVVARAGAGLVTEAFRRELERKDQVANLTTLRQLNDLDHQVLDDPERGILRKQGLAAMEGRQEAVARWDEQSGLIAANLTTDRQKLFFEQQRLQRRARLLEQIDAHGVSELRRHEQIEFTAFIDSSQNRAITNAANPRVVTEAAAEQEAAIRDYAKRNGIGPEAVDAMLVDARNKTWAGAITQNLASGNTRGAKVYFDEAKEAGLLTGEALARMTEVVKRGVTDAEGERAAAEIWTTLGPATDVDPIHVDQMEAAARERFGDDVDGLKATIAALRSRKTGVDEGRRERLNARDSAIWDAVLAGRSYEDVRRLPEAVANPEELLKVRDYLDRQAATAESRAASREARAAAREQREYSAELRRERRLELEGWATYFELQRPEVLRGLNHGEIVSKLPTLGSAHVDRLLRGKAQIDQDDATYRAATIDDDLFKDIATEALGFNAYALAQPGTSIGKEQRANLGKLRAAVEDEIARRQVAAGRRLSREETEAVMQQVVDTKVMLRDVGWFYRDEEAIAAVVDPKNRASAYVPIDQVPEGPSSASEDYANFLRGEMPALARVPTSEIRARYGQRFERAFALRLLGAKRNDIEAALRGQ